MRLSHLLGLLVICFVVALRAAAWTYEPNPHAGGHLVVLPATGFTDAAGKAAAADRNGELFGTTVKVAGPITRPVEVKYAGKYQLWVRVAEGKPQNPLAVELLAGGKTVLKREINDGPGAPGTGGAEAFETYRNEAVKNRIEGGGKDPGDDLLGGGDGVGGILNEINNEANPELKWINANRIEKVTDGAPCYWWKIGDADLASGRYTLRLSGGPGVYNAGFLTTSKEITYPFGGDIDIPPASYIRFRLDKLPRGGAPISVTMRIHSNPYFGTGPGYCTEEGMLEKPGKPLTKPGYTPWYCLQDLEHAPGFGAGTGHLEISVPAAVDGVTQFAVYPHDDQVLREFDFHEPEGTHISLLTDFKTYLSHLRTYRDHAREHYEYALAGSGERLFPLTRGPLYFQPNGGASGIPGDYAEKTKRLIGINVGSAPGDTDKQRRFGFLSQSGVYAPYVPMPFDEEKAKKEYDQVFGDTARSTDEKTVIYQEADEPGETGTLTYSAPLWRYYGADKGGPKWVDPVGTSILQTKKYDYRNCVVEGKLIKQESGITMRLLGLDDNGKEKELASWYVGKLPYTDDNVRIAQGEHKSQFKKLECSFGGDPTPFKIIVRKGTAGLYVNNKLVYLFTELPEECGFAIDGGQKTITALTFRQPRKDEKAMAGPAMADPNLEGTIDLGDDEEDDAPPPAWAKAKPLDQLVKDDWQFAGGEPEARQGFRAWLKAQGVAPALFGKKAWDEVNMLTVANLCETPEEKRLFYWSRKYCGYLTPKMFSMAAEAMRAHSKNKDMLCFVGLSGHSLNFPSQMPLDMFQLAQYGGALMPGVSDAMSMSGWRWDSHESVGFSVAPFNGGAKRYGADFGQPPISTPMMHCMWPNVIRAYAQIANNVKYQSYWCWGPEYLMTEWYWSESAECYGAVASICDHSAMVDDVLSSGVMRDSRVAMLWAMSTEYWGGQTPFTDRRPAFLGLGHEYFKPYLVNEDQLLQGALDHYDALYVMDPYVSEKAQAKIAAFVQNGGILWTSADALTKNEYNEPSDLLAKLGLQRTFLGKDDKRDWTMKPEAGQTAIHAETVPASTVDRVTWDGATVRARFGDGRVAWAEKTLGKGRVVYLAFRAGHNYGAHAVRPPGVPDIWSDMAREPLVLPLKEAKIDRELILNQPSVMASPLTNANGTVIVLYNLQGATAKDIEFALKEKAKPVSVQVFDDKWKLIDLPFEYRDGRAIFTLASLPQENMILVRSKPAPADGRVEDMRKNAVAMLDMKGWEDISTGAWYAGFYPEWKLGDRLIPLLTHEHYMVRRQAGESLGRLGYAPAADALAAQIAKEKDSHALADMLYALAQLNDARFPGLASATMSANVNPLVRKQILRGAALYLGRQQAAGKLDAKLKGFGADLFALGSADLDARVYGEAVPVLGLVDPQRALALWRESYATGDARLRGDLADVVAHNDALLDAAVKDLPTDVQAVTDLAQRRADKRIAAVLVARFDDVKKTGNFWPLIAQQDPELAKFVFSKRAELPGNMKNYVTTMLERAFNARIGNSEEMWTQYLQGK